MVNPSVTNADRSCEFIAIVIDDALSAGLSQISKGCIERAIKDCGHGSTSDARYFEDVEVECHSLSGLPKCQLRKRRCCSISLSDIDKETVLNFRQGMH